MTCPAEWTVVGVSGHVISATNAFEGVVGATWCFVNPLQSFTHMVVTVTFLLLSRTTAIPIKVLCKEVRLG